jgi:hypothetical protein
VPITVALPAKLQRLAVEISSCAYLLIVIENYLMGFRITGSLKRIKGIQKG